MTVCDDDDGKLLLSICLEGSKSYTVTDSDEDAKSLDGGILMTCKSVCISAFS